MVMKNHSILTHVFRVSKVFVIIAGFLRILRVSVSGVYLNLTGGNAGTITAFDGDLTAGSGSFLVTNRLEKLNGMVREER